MKLVVNRNLPCTDSTTSLVKVFPGFRPDFTIEGQCKNTPIQFKDITTATYGVVDNWKWNFGDPVSPFNTSILQYPTHIYANTGTYNVAFTVGSSKGCIDTVYKTLDILDKPPLTVTNDTLICFIDTLQLFEKDKDTHQIVLVGEIGGGEEEAAADYIRKNISKPVVSYITGRTAPQGKTMGHAGAVISGKVGTAATKIDALKRAGIPVAELPSEVPHLLKK